jgi:salicylate hydroxylase
VHYYVRRGELVNWIAHFEADWRDESWTAESDWREAASAYKGWNPLLAELYSRTQRCYKWALYDRDPLPRWSTGRVSLLGDAAHAMLPYLAQGAAQAIEDGYVLADQLDQFRNDPRAALLAYEEARRPRTSRIQLHARERGKINNATSPLARLKRDIGYRLKRLIRPKEHTYKIEWIYGHDVTAGRPARSAAA